MILNAIYDRLTNSTELTDIVGEKIFATYVPEKESAPAIAYNAITNPKQTTSGYAYAEDSVEIICLSSEYDEAAYLAQTVAELFYNFGFNVGRVMVQHSKVDSISRAYNNLYKEYSLTVNITFKSKIT